MGLSDSWRRVTGFSGLVIAIIFAVVSMTAINWVTDRNITDRETKINLGLHRWQYHVGASGYTSDKFTYDNSYYYSSDFGEDGLGSYLGSANDWKQAGVAVLALGSMAVILTGLTFFSTLATWRSRARPTNWYWTALPSWVAGFCFILGALIYEGMRPSFHGNTGYEWPMGLFITAGVLVDLAAILFYWETVRATKQA